MRDYRTDIHIRIFGLLVFALGSTLLLAYGIKTAGVEGKTLGVQFWVSGPSAAFLVMILIFFVTGLFKFVLKDDQQRVLNYPIEKLKLEEIENMLDELLAKTRKIERRKEQLEAAKKALQAQSTQDEVMTAIGMRRVGRPTG